MAITLVVGHFLHELLVLNLPDNFHVGDLSFGLSERHYVGLALNGYKGSLSALTSELIFSFFRLGHNFTAILVPPSRLVI